MDRQALEGIRIVDLSMGWAGPLAARHLADMGAQVIKIESLERFDWWRSWEATPEWIEDDGAEKSVAFNMVNRNKLNVTLDLEDPRGRDLLLKLVAGANAVVENYSGGVLPKLKLGYDVFCEAKANIILLSMPPFGANGPWAEFRAYGSTVEQSSGLPHLNGGPDDPPTMQHVAYGDAVGGITGACALLVALRHQAKTGLGQYMDLSQVEGLFPLAAEGILHYSARGQTPNRARNMHQHHPVHGVFPCMGEDNWIVIEARDETEWQALKTCAAPTLDAFDNIDQCRAESDEINKVLSTWTRDQDASTLMHALQENGVPAASTLSASDLINHPQLEARDYWQWRDRAVVGNQPNPSPPYRGDSPLSIDTPAPTLGQHNTEVLSGILGLTQDELGDLEAAGIIGTRPRMPT